MSYYISWFYLGLISYPYYKLHADLDNICYQNLPGNLLLTRINFNPNIGK